MASMVAKACTSTSSQMPSMAAQEKGSRNKRKFRADGPPLADPSKPILLPSSECTSFEFSAEKFSSHHGHTNGCGMCCVSQDSPTDAALKLGLGLPFPMSPSVPTRLREDTEDEFHDADWSDLTESELEELVLSNLDTIFKSAIKKIVASGYSEEVATKAILRSGLWYGCKDTVSNVVDNTISFLRSGQQIDPSREHYFEDLQQMERYILAELVCLLREVRPFFSTGDAMWCLLICDMNVSHACAMDGDPLGSFLANNTHNCPSEPPKVNNVSNSKPKASSFVPDKDCQNPTSDMTEKPFTTEEKLVGSKKVSGITKREYILRQKSLHFEKHYRTHGTKGASRASKINAFTGLVLDKKLKGVAESTGINPKNASVKENASRTGFTSVPAFGLESNLTVADTELSLSFPTKNIANPVPISYSLEPANCKPLAQWAPQNKKDEMIVKLVPRVRELQNQLQEWTEWANQKVMQAARRLSKDKAELKTLRQEKDEVERLKKEKQNLEESTLKKLSEMESALSKASEQVEEANDAVRRLDVENVGLRREMKAAKIRAAESASSCQEVLKREKRTLVKFQSWEKQKTVFQEELSGEKSRLVGMRVKLQNAKGVRDQVEAKANEEEKVNAELLMRATSFKKEREQIEASTQSKEDTINSRAQTNLQKHRDDIDRLEKEISRLRLKTDSSKIAALRRGIDGSYASKLTDPKTARAHKGTAISHIPRMGTATNGVKRERECVMCLSEEMSVVFLPCAHQVVCTTCNELHEKQGMKDCPSCRGVIQRRVCVRYARP